MAADGSRPKSVAYVNAASGFALVAALTFPLGGTDYFMSSARASLVGGLVATFLVVVNPVSFALKKLISAWTARKIPPNFISLARSRGYANPSTIVRNFAQMSSTTLSIKHSRIQWKRSLTSPTSASRESMYLGGTACSVHVHPEHSGLRCETGNTAWLASRVNGLGYYDKD